MEKQEYKDEHNKKNKYRRTIRNIKRTIPHRKRNNHRNGKNRRKNKPRYISIQFNKITQHKTRNKKTQKKT